MFAALRNFAMITIICIIGLGVTWLYVRNSSLANPVMRAHDHPFLAGKFPVKVAYYPVKKAYFPIRAADIVGWKDLPADVIFWIPVNLAEDGALQVRGPDGKQTPLMDVIKATGTRRLVLDFTEDRPGTAPNALDLIDASKAEERILIQSPIAGFMRDLRERRAPWLYGVGTALTTRLKMMASIGLEASVPIDGDVLVLEHLPINAEEFGANIFADAHRRKLHVFAGPVDTKADADLLFSEGADAVMITDMAQLNEPAPTPTPPADNTKN